MVLDQMIGEMTQRNEAYVMVTDRPYANNTLTAAETDFQALKEINSSKGIEGNEMYCHMYIIYDTEEHGPVACLIETMRNITD